MSRVRSRLRRGMGDATFSSTSTVTCPPGYHDDGAGTIRGMGACVPNKVAVLRPAVRAPASSPAVTFPGVNITAQLVPSVPAGQTMTPAAGAPITAPAPTATCPPLWPWWWLLVAAAAGGAVGAYVGNDKKKAKKNAARMAHAVGGRLVNAGAARLFA